MVADVVRLVNTGVDTGAERHRPGGGVGAVMPDGPEQYLHGAGGAGEMRGQEGVQVVAAARQREEVVRVVAALAGGAPGNEPGDAEEDLVREVGELHGGEWWRVR